jgi:hypothetical protein
MNRVFRLSSEQAVTKYAKAILQQTEMSLWMSTGYFVTRIPITVMNIIPTPGSHSGEKRFFRPDYGDIVDT